MREDADKNDIDPELQQRVRDLPLPRPEPGFRERNRRMFTGEIPFEPADIPVAEMPASRGWLWGGLGLAAAAALALLFILPGRGPSWEVQSTETGNPLIVDGRPTDASDLIGQKLASGTRIRTGEEGEVVLLVAEALTLVLGPRTEVTVGAAQPPGSSSVLYASVHEGITWGTTGPEFPKRGLSIETRDAMVHVTGTTFAVESGPENTCVCVLQGSVGVECKASGETHTVPPDRQLYVSADDGPTRLDPLTEEQAEKLRHIRARGIGGP
jgi:hypothetical protein